MCMRMLFESVTFSFADFVCVCIYLHVCTYVCMYVCMSLARYIYECMYVGGCMCIYILDFGLRVWRDHSSGNLWCVCTDRHIRAGVCLSWVRGRATRWGVTWLGNFMSCGVSMYMPCECECLYIYRYTGQTACDACMRLHLILRGIDVNMLS